MPSPTSRPILLFALVLGFALSGCATSGGSDGPVVSPTGKVYERGTPPEETRFSQTAALYIRRGRLERAGELAREGIDADPENPIHYYLAGVAHARLGQYEEADRLFVEAERIYPAYELDIEPEREAAWADAFNAGTDAYGEGDLEGALESWERATIIYDLRPGAHRNLASVLADEGRYDEAIEAYRETLEGLEKKPATRVLDEEELRRREEVEARTEGNLAQLLLFRERFAEAEPLLRRRVQRDSTSVRARSDLARALDGMGRTGEATEIYSSLLSESDLASRELSNLGAALFRAKQYAEAGRAFERLTDLQPNSRDAWFNYANALFAAEEWKELASVGPRLLEVDPLGENAALIVARAHLESGDERAALQGLEQADAAPVHVEGLRMQPSGDQTRVRGEVVGNDAEPGTSMRLRFTFYDDSGALGSDTVAIAAPPPDESAPFEISIRQRAATYRYELLR